MTTDLIFQPLGQPVSPYAGFAQSADIDPRLTRTHYFDGRLLTADDLNRDQTYLDRRLREVGQALGHGILRGLSLSLNQQTGTLHLSPGIGLSSAGRVLQLSIPLDVNLNERAEILTLNNGLYQRLERGLYAVVLKYAEEGKDVAEVFPTDLGTQKTAQYDVICDSVQLGLVRLPLPLAQMSTLHIRATLARKLAGDSNAGGAIQEDAVALGLLAISDDRPQWLDVELLRHPIEESFSEQQLQQKLSRHYNALITDIVDERNKGSLDSAFSANDYFQLLPPAGSLPKAAINPVKGTQHFFPDHYDVWIAPVRQSDLELIKQESMTLPPLDLALNEAVDIIVLAPLDNNHYHQYARRLERAFNPDKKRLASLDLLRLKIHPRRPVHELDTDAATWQAIWDTIGTMDLAFVRRPLRAAETAVSGIVLATGTSYPSSATDTTLPDGDSTASSDSTEPTDTSTPFVLDEDSIFLERVNLKRLSTIRPPSNNTGEEALNRLQDEFGKNAGVIQLIMTLLLRIDQRYDPVLWPTLYALAHREALKDFRSQLIESQQEGKPTGESVEHIAASLGIDIDLSGWPELDPH